MRIRVVMGVAFALAALLLGTSGAGAAGLEYRGWGVRGGFSSSPDQFVIGMHADLGEPAQNVRVTPNVDLGLGDNFTVVTINPDITYEVPVQGAGTLYFGGAVGLIYWNWDYPNPAHLRGVDTDGLDLGVAGIAGYRFPMSGQPLALDLKIGITDEYPDLKLMLAYTFSR